MQLHGHGVHVSLFLSALVSVFLTVDCRITGLQNSELEFARGTIALSRGGTVRFGPADCSAMARPERSSSFPRVSFAVVVAHRSDLSIRIDESWTRVA
jgi:hypothetical protein